MVRRYWAILVSAAGITAVLSCVSPAARDPQAGANDRPIKCSVVESFADDKLGVRTIIFHQHDKADRPRLGSLLAAHSGEEMELETAGRRYRAAVFRMKSCFGRGLLLVPINQLQIGVHDEFTLRPLPQ